MFRQIWLSKVYFRIPILMFFYQNIPFSIQAGQLIFGIFVNIMNICEYHNKKCKMLSFRLAKVQYTSIKQEQAQLANQVGFFYWSVFFIGLFFYSSNLPTRLFFIGLVFYCSNLQTRLVFFIGLFFLFF